MAFTLRLRGHTCLHASALAIADQAIALMGAPGAGKSTTAAAFAQLGYAVLSDDVAVLADLDDVFLVQPGYPRVNLWPDSVRTLFESESALHRITPTWDKRYLALDQDGLKFQSTPLPLGAIYVLDDREAELNTPVIEGVTGREAMMTVVANTYVNYLLDRNMRASEFDVLSRLLARVPVRVVRPIADPGGIFTLCDAIIADAKRLGISDGSRATLEAN
jgi:energy-coupling factor transporter ATP-binding protein EcfA2